MGEKLGEKPGKVLEAQTKVIEKPLAAEQVDSAKRGLSELWKATTATQTKSSTTSTKSLSALDVRKGNIL